ncbi:MAG: hypothetical protein RL557_689 [archaeon]|jgi:hypothetical protein
MPQKRRGKRISQKNALAAFEKTIEKDIKDTERWVLQRRKFFKKMAWLVALIILLIIFLSLLAGM